MADVGNACGDQSPHPNPPHHGGRSSGREPLKGALSLGVIGYPLGHTLSPALHRAALAHYGLAGSYEAWETTPRDLAAMIRRVRTEPLHGLNVTLPHKVAVVPLLDALTPRARQVGAVNTLYWDGDALTGDNTDVAGFLAQAAGLPLAGARVVVLGAGGAARAVWVALAEAGVREVAIVARREPEAAAAAEALNDQFPATRWTGVAWEGRAEALEGADAVVQTTPLGMAPHADASPLDARDLARMQPHAAVLDLVYRPRETRLLAIARERGLAGRGGLTMLAAQAAHAFERWTGVTGALTVFQRVAEALPPEGSRPEV